MNLNQLDTEQSNPDSLHIDEMSTIDILTTINNEDQKVALAVKEVLPKISITVDCIYYQMCKGGRLIYIGAGSTGINCRGKRSAHSSYRRCRRFSGSCCGGLKEYSLNRQRCCMWYCSIRQNTLCHWRT